VTVKIPPLRLLTDNQGEVAVENATTVQAALEELARKYPGSRTNCSTTRAPAPVRELFRNDEDVRHGKGSDRAPGRRPAHHRAGDRRRMLTAEQQERYSRHLLLDGFDQDKSARPRSTCRDAGAPLSGPPGISRRAAAAGSSSMIQAGTRSCAASLPGPI